MIETLFPKKKLDKAMESSATQHQEGTSLRVKLAILTVFVGCSLNVIFLELLVKADTGCGNLVTFTSFLFISVEGFIFTSDFGRKTPKVPLRAYSTVSFGFKYLQNISQPYNTYYTFSCLRYYL